MRIHSDHLVRRDLAEALSESGLGAEGVVLWDVSAHRSRSRHHAFEVALRAPEGRDRFGTKRRNPATGTYGSPQNALKAATYDEWGLWIAVLFERDPDAVIGPYNSRRHFETFHSLKYAPTTV
jgi:hypothetical protein